MSKIKCVNCHSHGYTQNSFSHYPPHNDVCERCNGTGEITPFPGTFEEYEASAKQTATFSDSVHKMPNSESYDSLNLSYVSLGLNGEAGEVADKVKKIIRDKNGVLSHGDRIEIAKELGDVLWYITIMSDMLGYKLSDIAKMNVDKLSSRKDRGVIGGEGDNR